MGRVGRRKVCSCRGEHERGRERCRRVEHAPRCPAFACSLAPSRLGERQGQVRGTGEWMASGGTASANREEEYGGTKGEGTAELVHRGTIGRAAPTYSPCVVWRGCRPRDANHVPAAADVCLPGRTQQYTSSDVHRGGQFARRSSVRGRRNVLHTWGLSPRISLAFAATNRSTDAVQCRTQRVPAFGA